jgi:hypothetical protein
MTQEEFTPSFVSRPAVMEAEVLMCEVYGPLRGSLSYVTFTFLSI